MTKTEISLAFAIALNLAAFVVILLQPAWLIFGEN
jgi:hypothetical protein